MYPSDAWCPLQIGHSECDIICKLLISDAHNSGTSLLFLCHYDFYLWKHTFNIQTAV